MKIEDIRTMIPNIGIDLNVQWDVYGLSVRVEHIRKFRDYDHCVSLIIPVDKIENADQTVLKNVLKNLLIACNPPLAGVHALFL